MFKGIKIALTHHIYNCVGIEAVWDPKLQRYFDMPIWKCEGCGYKYVESPTFRLTDKQKETERMGCTRNYLEKT